MTCFHPLKAWSPASQIDGGRYVFDATKALNADRPSFIPCGQCVGCRSERSSSWAVRCHHESVMHSDNVFLTLTYADEHMPANGSISLREMQLFMKRVRNRFGQGVRFFACGEYGETTLRPHYHLLIFGMDFPDKVRQRVRNGHPVYTSDILAELWPFGSHEIGSVTPQSAGYCSQYVRKKLSGPLAATEYLRPHPVTGEVHRVEPEFGTQSRKPGLGDAWFKRFASDAFPSDFLVIDGRKVRPPSYYLKKLAAGELVEPGEASPGRVLRDLSSQPSQRIKRRRTAHALKPEAKANSTPERLAVREYIHKDRLKRLVRSL
jgi:hypothetical protein